MRRLLLPCFSIIQLLNLQLAYSQDRDSLSSFKNTAPETAQIRLHPDESLSSGSFHFKNLIVPSAMTAYGIVGLRSHRLRDANKEVQEELWLEKPHKQIHVDDYLQWAPAVAVYGLHVAGINGKHNFKDRTIIYGISTILMSSAVYEVKRISKERRPDGSDLYSFPSGHTANAFATAEFMRLEYKDVSIWYGVGGYAAAAFTGYLRLYNNKHWLSDVIAGAGVGILSTNLAYIIYAPIKRMFSRKNTASTIILPAYRQGVASIGAIHTF